MEVNRNERRWIAHALRVAIDTEEAWIDAMSTTYQKRPKAERYPKVPAPQDRPIVAKVKRRIKRWRGLLRELEEHGNRNTNNG